ncbi:MAG: acyltransferase family protein [Saprospiraceae bacterium]
MGNPRKNNFDLIRFLAALQVLIIHARAHLKIESEFLDYASLYFLKFFPGVPIFFFISGFLIYGSFERNKDNLKKFFWNRFLRIYPALWVCFLFVIVLLLNDFTGHYSSFFSKEILFWIFGQLSIFQFYTPDILRFWGVGAPNGSLWTITVEVQFYLLIPFLFWFFSRFNKFWLTFGIVFLVSLFVNYFVGDLKRNGDDFIANLGGVFVLSYLHYFLIGVLIRVFWKKLKPYFEHKFLIWLIGYLLLSTISTFYLGINTNSYWLMTPVNLLADFILAGVTFSMAYSFYGISSRLLRGNDISYGLYIYHMLVVNFLVQRNCFGEMYYLMLTIIVTMILAFLSWRLVEKSCLKLK